MKEGVCVMSLTGREGELGLRKIGEMRRRMTGEIARSRIGVGMECLDRRMYLPKRTYGHLKELGAKWARLQTGWSRCETKKGVYDFAWLDEVVDNVIACGVTPWFNVGYGNKLYSPDAPHDSAVGQVPLYDGKQGVEGWRRFLRALAERYKGKVAHWEIWNEPNLDCFWHPKHKASAVEYTKLVSISSEAIKSVQPDAKVIACVAGIYGDFFEDCLKAGMGTHIDIFSYHPYRAELNPEIDYPQFVGKMRRLLAIHAPHVRLWQGECGAPAHTTGHHDMWMKLWNMNEMNQAKWVMRRLLIDHYLDLEFTSYFHLCDLMETPYRQSDGTERPPVMLGLLNGKTYTPKLAFHATRNICSLFDADTTPDPYHSCFMTPHERDDLLREPYLMLFRRNDIPILAYYQAVNPQYDIAPTKADVTLCCDNWPKRLDELLPDPVLADPISGQVYSLDDWERMICKDQFRPRMEFRKLPCLDYPLLITDKSVMM